MVVSLVTTRSIFGFGRRAVARFKSLSTKATKAPYEQWISRHLIAHEETARERGAAMFDSPNANASEGRLDLSLAEWKLGHCGVIVSEGILYESESRTPAANSVVAGFERRQRLREKIPRPNDKRFNPLCAVPGTPGIGKSTFLRHLPYTPEYENYLGKHFPKNSLPNKPFPIVVPVTFNSGMGAYCTADSFAARMLYGAATELFLGLGIPEAMTWSDFHEKHRSWCEHGPSAIKLLLQTFGDRPLILLVDEVSKLETETDINKVMRQIGTILDDYGNCDCVVSSLSPMFIEELLTGSQRKIHYTLLPTLPDKSPIVRDLVEDFIAELKQEDKAIAAAEYAKKTVFSMNLLKNLPLLLNDYPRQLERCFVDNDESIQDVIKDFAKKHVPGGNTMCW